MVLLDESQEQEECARLGGESAPRPDGTYEQLKPYPNQRMRVVYSPSDRPPAS